MDNRPVVDLRLLAFELEALFVAANARSLLGDERAYAQAESAIDARLG